MLQERASVDVSEPKLPRSRKTPKRFEVGSSEPTFPDTPEVLYRRYYFEALDVVIQSIKKLFEQPGFQIYRNLQDLLLKAVHDRIIHVS